MHLRHRMAAGVRRYEDLVCWQLSYELHKRVVAFCVTEPAKRDWKFCTQATDASASAPRNIAEGFGRWSNGDFARFLDIARGSLLETHNHLRDALDRRFLAESDFNELTTLANRAIGATTNLSRYLKARPAKNPRPKNP